MSGIGFTEVVVLFVIGLLILGPERLPRVASQIGRWVGKARRTANQLRYQLEREVALADIEETRKSRHEKKPSAPTGDSSAGDDVASAKNTAEAATDSDTRPDPEDRTASQSGSDSSAADDSKREA